MFLRAYLESLFQSHFVLFRAKNVKIEKAMRCIGDYLPAGRQESEHFAASTKGGSVLWRRNRAKWSRESDSK